ncbi:MAG TPA: TetR/AcrR family transcriptional regulator [Planococcus sp. (in: firmicutes)]|nr:TetR/AcrR family transcriptional regulator [Planococcus sp. (in: firmicutes)]
MDKRQELMKQATRFFSSKGFHQTSVQEIAQGAGISKGAFYKHFDSKESLFIELLKRYQLDLNSALAAPRFADAADTKQAFIEKLVFEFDKTISDKDFFLMIFKDFPKDENGHMQALLQELRAAQLDITKSMLLEVYGVTAKPFIADLAALFDGMKREFFIYLIFENEPLDVKKLARFIVDSMDAIVSNLEHMEPVLSAISPSPSPLDEAFSALEEKIRTIAVDTKKRSSSLRLLKEEAGNPERQDFLIEALIAYLAQEPKLEPELSRLQKLI